MQIKPFWSLKAWTLNDVAYMVFASLVLLALPRFISMATLPGAVAAVAGLAAIRHCAMIGWYTKPFSRLWLKAGAVWLVAILLGGILATAAGL